MSATTSPSIIDVHTPVSSFAIVHSLKNESMQQLCDKLTRKCRAEFRGERVQSGWIKYIWGDSVWNLDDDRDYTIFGWRSDSPLSPARNASGASATLHVRDPAGQLPDPPAYRNPSFYLFQPSRAASLSSRRRSLAGSKDKKSTRKTVVEESSVVKHRKEFEKFHSENGVRTVMGTIGPVDNVRMLLKNGYRHVYISRKFALKHGFVPADATPGYYGYGGLVNLGKWPITLLPAALPQLRVGTSADGGSQPPPKPKTVSVSVYLSEEPHFDVVLGRSFFESRQMRISSIDPTEVVCMDTGEKIVCELVVLKDGRGDIVTVT